MVSRPLPSDEPDRELADAVSAAIADIWRSADLTSEEFWDRFSGGKWVLPQWKSGSRPGFTDRLIALFQCGKASSGFTGDEETWKKLRLELNRGGHLVVRLGDYKSRFAAWKSAEKARRAAEVNDVHRRRSQTVCEQSHPDASVPAGPVADPRWMSLADFAVPSDEMLKDMAWRFLCGDPPTPVTAIHAAVRRDEIDKVLEKCRESGRIVILHGPVGEGASTAVLQAAHQAATDGRAVLRIRGRAQMEIASALIGTATTPLFIVEDDHDLAQAPAWINTLMDNGGSLLIGTQTRRVERLNALFDPKLIRTVSLGSIGISTADAFVANINRFAPTADSTRRERFLDGLGLSHGRGGLWPAQYQATRGEALDHRVEIVVQQFEADLRPMLSALVFVGWTHDQYPNIPPPSWSNVLALYAELDLRDDLLDSPVHRLERVVRALDGEFFARLPWASLASENDPILALRHRAVTDSLFRWLFGAHRSDQGDFLFEKWEYFIIAVAESADAGAGGVAFALTRLMERSHRYDFEHGGDLKHRLSTGRSARPGDFLMLAIDHAYDAASPSQRRQLDLMRARLWAWGQWGRKIDEDEQARALERATAVVASGWIDKDFSAVCSAAVIFDALKATYGDDPPHTAFDLLDVAEAWEPQPSADPSSVARSRMTLLARAQPYPAHAVAEAAPKAEFLTWQGWHEERLEVLQRLIKSARNSKANMGAPSDTFGLSRRSLYAAFLKELVAADARLSTRGVVSLSRPGDYLFGLVRAVIRDWVDDEDAAYDDDGWPDGLIDELRRMANNDQATLNFGILSSIVCQLNGDHPP